MRGVYVYAPINSKVQHPPRAIPRAFELLKIGLVKFPPLGAKKPFKCPTKEICHNDTFKLLLTTLLKELFTNKGEILSCKSVKLQKMKKPQGVLRQNKR